MSDIPISSFDAIPSTETASYQPDTNYQPTPSGGPSNDLAEGFLKNVDPRDRPVVEKYIRDWDRGVNQRFREIHTQYEPYKNLGADIDDIQTALQISRLIDSDPRYIWEAIGNEFGFMGQQVGNGGQPAAAVPASGAVGQGSVNPAYEGLPEPFVTEFSQMRDLILAMGQKLVEQENQSKQSKEDAELENYIGDLHKKHGDFDEDYVLAKMWNGMDGEQAIQEFRSFVQNTLNSRASTFRPVPPILNGGGAVPNGMRPEDLSRGQARSIMADMLAKANQQNS